MAGRGALGDTAAVARVFMLNKNMQWVPARNPLHFDKPKVAGVGPGLSFGKAMAKRHRRRKIGLIPAAVGGTSIDVWVPGAYDKVTRTHPYDDMMQRLQEAMKSGVLRGAIWLQGEADSSPEELKLYLAKLQVLIEKIRAAAHDPQLPFVAGELGTYRASYQRFNTELARLPSIVAHTAVASSVGFTHKGDQTHFDAASAEAYGKRFAEKMQQLQK